MFTDFNPEKHKGAYKAERLYEWQEIFEKDKVLGEWVKVVDDATYADAINNPIFFAVKEEED